MNNQVFEEVINKLILFFFLPLIQPLISTVVSLYKTVFNIQLFFFFYALQALAHTSNCLLKLSTWKFKRCFRFKVQNWVSDPRSPQSCSYQTFPHLSFSHHRPWSQPWFFSTSLSFSHSLSLPFPFLSLFLPLSPASLSVSPSLSLLLSNLAANASDGHFCSHNISHILVLLVTIIALLLFSH